MSDIDSIDIVEPFDKPMKPGAMDATPEQSNAYRKLLESKEIKPPTEYKTPVEIEQRRRMNDWSEQLSKISQVTEIKPVEVPKSTPPEPVEQSV